MAFCDNKRGIISEAKPTRIAQSEIFFLTITQNTKMTFLGYSSNTNLSCITKRNNAMMSKPKTCWVKKLVSKKEKGKLSSSNFFVPQVIFSLHLASLLSKHMRPFLWCKYGSVEMKKYLFFENQTSLFKILM